MIIGLVGKPSAGKSTLFKALTLADVGIANYPFTTIEPNTGAGHVKIECVDKEFNTQCNPREGYCKNHFRFVPVKLIDVAGLVPGAHEGKGLGLSFLDDLNQADVLIHVVDAAGLTNERGEPVKAGEHNPVHDITFLENELDYWYMNILKRTWEKVAKTARAEKQSIEKVLAKQLSGVKVTEEHVRKALKHLPEHYLQWNDNHLLQVCSLLRSYSKPIIIAANKSDVSTAEKNIENLRKEFPQLRIIQCSGDSELALREASKKGLIEYLPGEKTFTIKGKLSEQQQKALTYIQENVLNKWCSTGVQDVLNTAVLDILHYIAIFPGGVNKLEDKDGNILPDCFLLPPHSTALDFAFRLHSDIGNNFVKAVDVKTKKVVGKEHVLKHRDVIEIMTKK